MSDSSTAHQRDAERSMKRDPVRCAVLTVSDTRTPETDVGGPLIEQHLRAAGHHVESRAIVRDDPQEIALKIEQWLSDPGIHAILITGGTGVARRDTTIEVVRRHLTIELEGFGELFRMLGFQQVKAAAMMSRAVGGLVVREPQQGGETFIFAMPGSPSAVETAMVNLIAPQLAHMVWERRK